MCAILCVIAIEAFEAIFGIENMITTYILAVGIVSTAVHCILTDIQKPAVGGFPGFRGAIDEFCSQKFVLLFAAGFVCDVIALIRDVAAEDTGIAAP